MIQFWLLFSLGFLSLAYGSLETHRYEKGENIKLYVNKVGPIRNPQETYQYYDLPFCSPKQDYMAKTDYSETLGEALSGFELKESLYQFKFLEPVSNQHLCRVEVNAANVDQFIYAVSYDYWFEFFFDELPVMGLVGISNIYGVKHTELISHYLYLHYTFLIEYNEDRIILIKIQEGLPTDLGMLTGFLSSGTSLNFSYDVQWIRSLELYQDRFERYHDTAFFESQVHYYSIYNSIGLCVILIVVVSSILSRTTSRDQRIRPTENEIVTGWRNIQADVFRPPSHLLWISAFLGVGAQLFIYSFSFIFFSYFIVYKSPDYSRGTLFSLGVVLFTLTSFFSGYVSGNYYKRHGGKDWKKCLCATIFIFPLFVWLTLMLLNILALSYQSLAHIPFTSNLTLLAIWIFIAIPLSIVGTLIGRNQGEVKTMGSISPFPNTIPPKRPLQQIWVLSAVSGLLLFAVAMMEIYFIYASLFEGKLFYTYSLLFVNCSLLVIATMCISIISTYVLLNSEDYRWQWVSIITAASTSGYYFLYSLYYWLNVTNMDGFLQSTFFFGYVIIISIAFAIFIGSVSYFSASFFVHKIYNIYHID